MRRAPRYGLNAAPRVLSARRRPRPSRPHACWASRNAVELPVTVAMYARKTAAASGPRSSAQRHLRAPAVLAQHEDRQRQDQGEPLEAAQHGQREEHAGPRAVAALDRQERRDHQQEEQTLGVGHRECRCEGVDDEETRSQRRATTPDVGGAEANEESQGKEERDVRHDDCDDPANAGNGKDRTFTSAG